MPEIIVKMDGADAVREALREVRGRVSNLSPIMKAIGDRIVEQTKRRFESGGPAPDGTPWAAPKTPNPKRLRTLTVSGHLRDSIRYQMIGKNAVAIGTNKVYAAIHQFGGTIEHKARTLAFKNKGGFISRRAAEKRKTSVRIGFSGAHTAVIPARPYLGLSEDNSNEIVGIINEYIAGR